MGAGGLGREAYDATLAAAVDVAGFLDDRLADQQVRGLPVTRPDDAPGGCRYVIAIADPLARARLALLLDGRGLVAATLAHPSAQVAPETSVGPGCLLLANAYVSSSVTLGPHCQVQYNATVGHDSVLAACVTVYPGANVSGSVTLAEGVSVGSNAVVLQGRRVGAAAFVGAGAVVTRDVAPAAVVVGSPARPLGSART